MARGHRRKAEDWVFLPAISLHPCATSWSLLGHEEMGQHPGSPFQASVHGEDSQGGISESAALLQKACPGFGLLCQCPLSVVLAELMQARNFDCSPGYLCNKNKKTNELLLHKFCVFGRINLLKPEVADERGSSDV